MEAKRKTEPPEEDATYEDFFGKDLEDDEDDEEKKEVVQEKRGALSDDETKAKPEIVSHKVKAPLIATGLPVSTRVRTLTQHPSSTKFAMVKLPNVVGIEPNPFDPTAYAKEMKIRNKEIQGKVITGKRSRGVKVGSENVIRWRESDQQDADGNKIKETNARIVRWSDGSSHLYLGGEVFEFTQQKLEPNKFFVFAFGGKGVSQCCGALSSLVKFKPSGIESRSHQSLKNLIAEQQYAIKVPKIKRTITNDPTKERKELEQREKDDLEKKDRMKKKVKAVSQRNRARQNSTSHAKVDADFLQKGSPTGEEDDEEEEFSHTKMRKPIDEEAEAESSRRLLQAKDDSKSKSGGSDGDDDDKPLRLKRRPATKRKLETST